MRELRTKLMDLHAMAPRLNELNHDGGRTDLAMARREPRSSPRGDNRDFLSQLK